MNKRLLSALLAALLLLTSAAAADSTPQDETQPVTLTYRVTMPPETDAEQAREQLQTILRERLTLFDITEAAIRLSEDGATVTVTLPPDAARDGLAATLGMTAALSFRDADGKAWLTGADVAEAEASRGKPTGTETAEADFLTLTLTEAGRAKFAEATAAVSARADDEKRLDIVLDETVIAAPAVTERIDSKTYVISGSFTAQSAKILAGCINAGALPAELTLLAGEGADAGDLPPEDGPPAETTEDPPFPDLAGHWAEGTLARAVELSLLRGIDGKLMPDSALKHAEALTVLNRTLGAALPEDAPPMTQVPAGAWYAEEVAKAAHLGLIDGDDARNFDTPSTRGEAFVLFARAFVYERAESPDDVLSAFADSAQMSPEQRRAAAALVDAGIVKGDTNGNLTPDAHLTRAEFVTMLLRIVPHFPGAEDDITALIGGALVQNDVKLAATGPDGDRVFATGVHTISLSGVEAADRLVLKGMDGVTLQARDKSALSLLAADAVGEAKLTLSGGSTLHTLLLAGTGGTVSYDGDATHIEITAAHRTISLSDMEADTLTITGPGNTIVMNGSAADIAIAESAVGTTLTLNGKSETITVAGRDTKISGRGKAESVDIRAVGSDISLDAASQVETLDPGLAGVGIEMGTPTKVTPGGSLLVQAKFTGVDESKTVSAQWYRDGKPIAGFGNDSFPLTPGSFSRHTMQFEFKKGMETSVTVGFRLRYYNPSTGETEEVFEQVTVPIENHSDEWYYQRDVNRVLGLVSSTYQGNYTQAYAINNDYQPYEKEVWVNAKGYSSRSDYLVWINRAYQHVNVFTGSKGNWKLHKSFVVGTGASGSPTPTGLTTVSYKSAAGWTTGSYTVRPVVGFYPGTGYAFHSRLCYPGTEKEYDFSSGYPVSHGCIRMQRPDINWMYSNIPVGTAVVIF